MARFVLALDQGTTSSRSILFDLQGQPVASSQQEFPQILPRPGWVEHDPEDIWNSQIGTARDVLKKASVSPSDIAAIGVTNQRETTVVWERATGRPIGNAIVWQSRVSAPICDQLIADGHKPLFQQKTGLVIDAYFSGTKLKHILDSHPGLRDRARRGEIACGTIDTYLLWRMTAGKLHLTDVSNASRTLIYNIHTLEWDEELLNILDIPREMLPEVRSSSEVYGELDPQWLGAAIPIAGIAGDQQAATFGQTCFEPGNAKNTYGTGCFLLLNTGSTPKPSQNNLLTTIGWKIGNEVTYCLEGSVFIAGAVIQWLRDGLGIIENSADVQRLAQSVPDSGGVIFVPAFVGLGAPYWDSQARGMMIGLTRGTSAAHVARAAVESMAYQSCELARAMAKDAGIPLSELRVDGGAAVNDDLMQFQSDMLGVTVRRPKIAETTALGAAYLAGLAVGFWQSQSQLKEQWSLDREFQPQMSDSEREQRYAKWLRAVERSRGWEN